MPSAKVYTFDKGSEEYEALKYSVSKKARRKLGIKYPLFGKNKNKVVIPDNFYQMVIRFMMDLKMNPELYLDDVLEVKQDG
jgi:hypothetical protein